VTFKEGDHITWLGGCRSQVINQGMWEVTEFVVICNNTNGKLIQILWRHVCSSLLMSTNCTHKDHDDGLYGNISVVNRK
jgi:hypothetical protein